MDIGGRHASVIGKHAKVVFNELAVIAKDVMESEHTKSLMRAIKYQAVNVAVTAKQAGGLMLNRALWSIAEYSNWVTPVRIDHFPGYAAHSFLSVLLLFKSRVKGSGQGGRVYPV